MSVGLIATGGSLLKASEEAFPREKVREHILQQLRGLDFMLENLGQALNNFRVFVSDKKAAVAYLIKARETMQELLQTEASYSECSLLYRNRKLIDTIAASLESHFTLMDEPSYAIDESIVEEIDTLSMEIELIRRDARLNLLTSYSEVLGLSFTNRFSRALAEFGKESGLTEVATRALPYIGWAAYWKFAVDAKVAHHDDHKKAKAVVSNAQTTFGIALVDSLPAVNLGLGVIFASAIKNDLDDLYGFGSSCCNQLIAHCKGELYNDGSGYTKPIAKFTDIIAAHGAKAELMSIVDYFKDKKAIDRIGASVDRSYLLTGPLDTSKGLANAVAGEISNVLKSQNKSSQCSLIEVHASSLINKSLKDVLKDAEKRAPCIVVLDEIDCLYAYGLRKIKSSAWADIIGSMNSLSKSRKDIFVITTAATDTFTDPDGLARFGVYSKVENPTHDDRINFFKRELERRAVTVSSLDLEMLASRTENYTFIQLTNVLKRACSQAHSLRQSLTQETLEEAIATKGRTSPGIQALKCLGT